MRALVACEKSGVLRRALRDRGVEAFSCDLEPSDDDSEFHIIGDAVETAYVDIWSVMVCHPECRFLSASGLHWNTRPGYEWRQAETEKAVDFALSLWRAPVKAKILENPRGKLGAVLSGAQRRYIVQPWMLGDDASKETFLFCDNIELLPINPALRLDGRIAVDPRNGRRVERWSNETDAGQNRLSPSEDRAAKRAETYPGIANWIADSIAAWFGLERCAA